MRQHGQWLCSIGCRCLLSSRFDVEVQKRGYFPSGGGKVKLSVATGVSAPLRPINLTDRGTIATVDIAVWHGGRMPRHVADKMFRSAKADVEAGLISRDLRYAVVTSSTTDYGVASCGGAGILVVATTSTGCVLAGLDRWWPARPTTCGLFHPVSCVGVRMLCLCFWPHARISVACVRSWRRRGCNRQGRRRRAAGHV